MKWTLDMGVGERPRGIINLDIIKTKYCNLVAEISHLPFKNCAFEKVWCSEVLEHLDNPVRALIEIRRVLSMDGIAEIDFPKPFFINNARYRLVEFILNLPFSFFPRKLKVLFRTLKGIKEGDPRWLHKRIISPKIVEERFKIIELKEIGDIFYSSGRKAKILGESKPKIRTAWLLRCRKNKSETH